MMINETMAEINSAFTILGLVEVLWNRQDFTSLQSAVIICKCFASKLWENSKFISRQLTGIGKFFHFLLIIKIPSILVCHFTMHFKVTDCNLFSVLLRDC